MAALGLLACGPIDKTSGDDSETGADTGAGGSTGSASTDPTTNSTTNPTANPTTGASTDTQGSESGSMTGQTDTGETAATSTGSTGSAETGSGACEGAVVPAEQGFTDPPVPSGFETCDAGILHRKDRLACEVPQTPGSCPADALAGCKADADCVEKPFGSCQIDMVFGGFTEGSCSCVYGCATDDDCAADEICRCAGTGLGLYTECIQAGCAADSDCADGELCGLSPDGCAPGGFLTACTTPEDTCEGCMASDCMFNIDKWECNNVACGRPFLVESQAVVAPLQARDDWRALHGVPGIDAVVASRLADYWAEIGRLEHASIASFAQFVLQLLAVGAPPTLVLAAQRALADEVEHARLCFGLASLYAGAGVGPGPLAIVGAAASVDLPSLIDAVIREACVGETLAAFEAREAAAQAEDPAVRATLAKISSDETRHAELGWQFVQWALAGADAAAWARARATFTAAVGEARRGALRDALAAGTPELRAHGVVDAPLRAQIWAEGLRAVIEPCAAALLDERRAA